jgi:hypothetical protein
MTAILLVLTYDVHNVNLRVMKNHVTDYVYGGNMNIIVVASFSRFVWVGRMLLYFNVARREWMC